MQVRVLFFGALSEVAGRTLTLELPERATLGELLHRCAEEFPSLSQYAGSIAHSVNQVYAPKSTVLTAGDEVALLPPVSGGRPVTQREAEASVRLTREKIDTARLIEAIKNPEDGAVAVFEGIARNHSRGRRTLYLEYEAYEEMALVEMQKLATEAKSQFAIRESIIVHRLGRIEINETSVLIVVASAHRAAAFDACRWLIDTLKQTVPIWKKEFFEDGAVWAPGEPFPAHLQR